jgi:hypothetical protein
VFPVIRRQLAGDECIERLIIRAHGLYSRPQGLRISIGGLQRPGLMFTGQAYKDLSKATEIGANNVGVFAKGVAQFCFCDPCTIFFAACQAGVDATLQPIADETGCKVIAPRDFGCTIWTYRIEDAPEQWYINSAGAIIGNNSKYKKYKSANRGQQYYWRYSEKDKTRYKEYIRVMTPKKKRR